MAYTPSSPFINIMITVSPNETSPVISALLKSGMSMVIAGQPVSGIGPWLTFAVPS